MPLGTTVGRPKKQAGKKPAGPKTIGVRSTPEWADWIDRAARHCRTDIAKLIDASVADYVKARGFNEAPPERIP
jgi:hypothetical protein